MNVYARQVRDLGFKGTHIMESAWQARYYKMDYEKCRCIIIHNEGYDKDNIVKIEYFDLTKKEAGQYKRGKLSLIPSGCCYPSHCEQKTNPTLFFYGTIKNKKELVGRLNELDDRKNYLLEKK